jgi:hypothetical protein
MMRRLTLALALGLGALVLAGPASAAAPRYIMITGPGIEKPILLANWRANGEFEIALANAAKAAAAPRAAVRTRLTLWLFWGWGEKRPTRPGQANQRGWLYPAAGSQPALIALRVNGTSRLRIIPASLLRSLERHGVPTRRHLPS